MISPDALPIVLDQNAMRPAAAGLGPAIALERGEDAGSFRHVAGRVLAHEPLHERRPLSVTSEVRNPASVVHSRRAATESAI